jgi:hypothetical protein
MKKSLIALAALAATASFAQTTTGQPGFQITGNLNAGYVSQNYFGNKVNGFEQNGMGTSNIFFRGLEDLGGGLKAHFLHGTDIQFMTLSGDRGAMYSATNTGAVGTFGNDQKLVGISGGFGTVNFGAINNASLYNGIVLLNPVVGTSYAGGYASTVCADPTCGVVRYDNTIEYKSPVMSGLQLFGQYAAKQNKAGNTNYTTTLGALNGPSMNEISAKYDNGPLSLAATRLETDASGVATIAAQVKKSLNTLTAVYSLSNGVRLAVLNQKLDNPGATAAASSTRTTNQASVIYTDGASTFGLNYGQTKEDNAARTTFGGQTSKFTGVNYKYALSKMTALEAKYENLDDAAGTVAAPGQFTRITNTRVRSTLGLNMNF